MFSGDQQTTIETLFRFLLWTNYADSLIYDRSPSGIVRGIVTLWFEGRALEWYEFQLFLGEQGYRPVIETKEELFARLCSDLVPGIGLDIPAWKYPNCDLQSRLAKKDEPSSEDPSPRVNLSRQYWEAGNN